MKKPLKVKEISQYIKNVLKRDPILANIKVEGEVSNAKKSGNNIYFSLKDEAALLNCVIFGFNREKITMPMDGYTMIATGTLSTYERGSAYNLIIKELQQKEQGSIYQRFEILKEQLRKEGLFDKSRKKEIPTLPENIGIITSIHGAAIRDMIKVIQRRYPLAKLWIYHCKVQGDHAVEEIIQGIQTMENLGYIDTLIIGRGGGSFEDLNTFNDEVLIRCIAKSQLPIISGVGHETDTTLIDYVSDLQASTPTAAGEMAVPILGDIIQNLKQSEEILRQRLRDHLSFKKDQLQRIEYQLMSFDPKYQMVKKNKELEEQYYLLQSKIEKMFKEKNKELDFYAHEFEKWRMKHLSKEKITEIIKDKKRVQSIEEIHIDDILNIYLFDGWMKVKVMQKEHFDDREH